MEALKNRRKQPAIPRFRGFTLLELLVAIAILAVVAVIAWQGLSTLLATRARLGPEVDDARAVVAGFGQMGDDLSRVPADAALFALPTQAIRVPNDNGQSVLEILRLAPSPDGSGASALEAVFYRVRDGKLEREAGPAGRSVFPADGPDRTGVDLIPGVDSMEIRVWRANAGWVPPSDADAAVAPGIEVRLRCRDGSVLRRVFLVGAR